MSTEQILVVGQSGPLRKAVLFLELMPEMAPQDQGAPELWVHIEALTPKSSFFGRFKVKDILESLKKIKAGRARKTQLIEGFYTPQFEMILLLRDRKRVYEHLDDKQHYVQFTMTRDSDYVRYFLCCTVPIKSLMGALNKLRSYRKKGETHGRQRKTRHGHRKRRLRNA